MPHCTSPCPVLNLPLPTHAKEMLFSRLISSPRFPLITLWSRASCPGPAKPEGRFALLAFGNNELFSEMKGLLAGLASHQGITAFLPEAALSPFRPHPTPKSLPDRRGRLHPSSVASVPLCWDALAQHHPWEGTIFLPRSSGHTPCLGPNLRTLIQSLLSSGASTTPIFGTAFPESPCAFRPLKNV